MATRVRRQPDDAKRLILEAASKLLAAGGPAAVQVRDVAAEVGVSDAAVDHHFGTRERLLESLLRFGGAKLKAELHTCWARGLTVRSIPPSWCARCPRCTRAVTPNWRSRCTVPAGGTPAAECWMRWWTGCTPRRGSTARPPGERRRHARRSS
ncbi:TetR/AcrR family transcriptional regulator [Nonomuraea dietziae]|uniref:TetR/AcrR family transcriptional regulator n=1 Tax=Nonomuraea dietziae TaxID=65515 RepID=UPI0033D82B36